MGYKKNKANSFQSGNRERFMQIFHDMYHSKAWQELTHADIRLYLHMLSKYQPKTTMKRGPLKGKTLPGNENNISVPRSEYIKFMHPTTFRKSIDHLIDLGFVKLVESRHDIRKCTIYGFSDAWQRYGKEDFYIDPKHRRTLQQQLDEEYKLNG